MLTFSAHFFFFPMSILPIFKQLIAKSRWQTNAVQSHHGEGIITVMDCYSMDSRINKVR